jgi:hypothetical protein
MPATIDPYLIGVSLCLGFFTGAGRSPRPRHCCAISRLSPFLIANHHVAHVR